MRPRARPRTGVDIEHERIAGHPDERVGDHVRVLGQKHRGQDGTGAGAGYVGGAHPVEERGAIVAGHAHDDSAVEDEHARCAYDRIVSGVESGRIGGSDCGRGRTISCFEMCHYRIKIAGVTPCA